MTSVRSELVPAPPGESVMCDALCAQVASDRVPGHRAVWFTSAFPLAVTIQKSFRDATLSLALFVPPPSMAASDSVENWTVPG